MTKVRISKSRVILHIIIVLVSVLSKIALAQHLENKSESATIEILLDQLDSRERPLQRKATDILVEKGITTLPTLIEVVKQRRESSNGLQKSVIEIIHRVLAQAYSEEPAQETPIAVIEFLQSAMRHENRSVRAGALDAIGFVRAKGFDPVTALIEGLNDPSPYVRLHATIALGTIGIHLGHDVNKPPPQYGYSAKQAVVLLRTKLLDSNEDIRVRQAAALAMVQLDPEKTRELAEMAKLERGDLRYAVVESLAAALFSPISEQNLIQIVKTGSDIYNEEIHLRNPPCKEWQDSESKFTTKICIRKRLVSIVCGSYVIGSRRFPQIKPQLKGIVTSVLNKAISEDPSEEVKTWAKKELQNLQAYHGF
jgi:HEAT repeat protein